MARKKTHYTWFYFALAIFFIAATLVRPPQISVGETFERKVTLNKKPDYVNVHRARDYYRLYTKEDATAYKVTAAGLVIAGWTSMEQLQPGDSLTVRISLMSAIDLNSLHAEITVYELQHGNRLLFNTEDYNRGEVTLRRRWNFIFILMAAIMVGLGLRLRTWLMLALVVLGVTAILIMRFTMNWW